MDPAAAGSAPRRQARAAREAAPAAMTCSTKSRRVRRVVLMAGLQLHHPSVAGAGFGNNRTCFYSDGQSMLSCAFSGGVNHPGKRRNRLVPHLCGSLLFPISVEHSMSRAVLLSLLVALVPAPVHAQVLLDQFGDFGPEASSVAHQLDVVVSDTAKVHLVQTSVALTEGSCTVRITDPTGKVVFDVSTSGTMSIGGQMLRTSGQTGTFRVEVVPQQAVGPWMVHVKAVEAWSRIAPYSHSRRGDDRCRDGRLARLVVLVRGEMAMVLGGSGSMDCRSCLEIRLGDSLESNRFWPESRPCCLMTHISRSEACISAC